MELHLTAEKEAQLHRLAARTGRDAAQVVEEAVDRLLEYEARFNAAVRDGFAAIDQGQFIKEEEMDARISRMLQSRESCAGLNRPPMIWKRSATTSKKINPKPHARP